MSAPTTLPSATPGRLASLDGLRGIAAFVVLLHHLMLTLPQVSSMPIPPRTGSHTWLVEDTPLKLVSAGSEAVLVFFVLSGMVVALPVLRRREFDWLEYYPRRVVRLGLPILPALALGTVLILAHPQVLGASVSTWVRPFSFPTPNVALFVSSIDPFLLTNLVDNPLWTIRFELLFSLALPLYVMLAVVLRRQWILSLVVVFGFAFLGARYGNLTMEYLPVFFAGTLLAVHHDALAAWSARVGNGRRAGIAWLAVLAGGCTLLILSWLVLPLPGGSHEVVRQLTGAASFLGATVVVAVCFLWQGARWFLTTAIPRWLGRVSFSLYLVHVPFIVFYANLFGPGHFREIVLCTLPSALVAAELFRRFVEQPTHRLSKRAGRRLSDRYRADRAGTGPTEAPPTAPTDAPRPPRRNDASSTSVRPTDGITPGARRP